MKPAVFSPQARRDVLDAVHWIVADNPGAARAFRATVEKAAIRLGEYPLLGRVCSKLADAPVRFLPLTSFPYVLIYDAKATTPLVLRVLHGARDLPELLGDIYDKKYHEQ